MNIFSTIKVFRILGMGFAIFISISQEGKSMQSFFDSILKGQHFGNVPQNTPPVQQDRRANTQAEETEKRIAAEKQAKEKAIAERIAFEKEEAHKRVVQMQEDEKKARAREQQQAQSQAQQDTRIKDTRVEPTQQTTQTQIHQEGAHQDGKSFASSLMGGVIGAATSTDPHVVPRFQTDKPKEASLNFGSIGDAALAEARTNEVSQHLTSQAQDRQNFKIDPNTDPLFVEGNRVVSDPQKAMNEEIIATLDSGEDVSEEIKFCEEGGEEFQQSCSKQLQITLKITPATTRTVYSCPGHAKKARKGWSMHYSHWTEYCNPRRCTSTEVDVPKVVEVASEKWIDGCIVLEDLTEKGLCRYKSKTTSQKNETRTIQGEPITRDHFEEYYRYTCFKAPSVSNSCAGLREKGCFQIGSICKEQVRLEKVGDVCVLWEQTYSCPSGKKSGKSYRSSSEENPSQTSLFCLTGNCADTSYEANNELLKVMSHLSVLREAQNDLKNFAIIFKGQQRGCTRNLWDFRDCCGSGKGWGVSLHLSSCDAGEVELRTLRDKKLCIQVGTYCAEKHLGQCTRTKTSFCCYGTKIARFIQENGRAQLGMGFGSPQSPKCEGLSPEQLSRIDFSKINFSEIFEDIKNQTVTKDQKQSLDQVSTDRIQENMTLLTKPPIGQKSSEELQKLKQKGL